MFNTIGGEEGGEFKAVASGALASGKPVVVNADGTVAVVAESSVSEAAGTAGNFHSASTMQTSVVHDAKNNRILIAYRDQGDSGKGKCIAGTLDTSNNTISFGSEVKFHNDDTQINPDSCVYDSTNERVVINFTGYTGGSPRGKSVVCALSSSDNSITLGTVVTFEDDTDVATSMASAYDSTNGKVVVFYRSTSNLRAIVGTVDSSDNSISFGTRATVDNSNSEYLTATFDSTNGKVVVGYQDAGNSNYGTARVLTVSGTSVSTGSDTVFESNNCLWINSTFDSTNGKVIFGFKTNNDDRGAAIVGTVSGTGISFGTLADFSTDQVNWVSVVYHPEANKVLFAYGLSDDSNHGYYQSGVVSGTSIGSFSTRAEFINDPVEYVAGNYDSTTKRMVWAWHQNTSPDYGKYFAYNPAFTDKNITSENYIGMSKGGAVADTENATVDIIGSVNNEQSSLTAGQQYFVQTDGTIGTTADDPSVLAGTAISATEILVKT